MYNKIILSFSSLIFVAFFLSHFSKEDVKSPSSVTDDKILLKREMVINEAALGEAWRLVDEQQIVGDPDKGTGKAPISKWQIDWNKKDYFPISAVIDLGKPYKLSKIYLFDAEGNGKVEVSTGTPFSWNKNFSDELNSYNKWQKHDVNAETRFIQVKLLTQVSMPEIVVYGSPVNSEPDKAEEKKTKKKFSSDIKMEHFIGINAFIDDPLDKIKAAGFVREYHVWDWDEGDKKGYEGFPNNKNAFNPSYAGGGWNFDAYYKKLKDAGIVIATCIQESPAWLKVPSDSKPSPETRDPQKPLSYKEHADHMFQVAARYGKRKVPDNLLKLAENQSRVSGLDLVSYYENWNEPDKDWKTRKEHFSPYEYAAMSSADYDGHMGKLGKTYGVKNADPESKLVMGGISALNLDYIKSIKFWSDWNRDGSVPFDVINLHHYSNDGGKQRSIGKIGVSPEADSLKQKLETFVDYRNTHMPDKEIWITEFGYDTHVKSVQRAPAIGSFSQEEVQAIWLIRSYLAIAAAGVDRAAMFMLRDTESKSGIQFNTSGLTSRKSENHVPKPSWYYVYTLKKHLKNHVFHKINSETGVMNYEFKNVADDNRTIFVWLPTSKGKEVKQHEITIPKNAKSATLIEFSNNSIQGTNSDLPIIGNKVKVSISEKPIMIVYKM